MGLAGLGDLVLTCTGDLSRNRRVGTRARAGRSPRRDPRRTRACRRRRRRGARGARAGGVARRRIADLRGGLSRALREPAAASRRRDPARARARAGIPVGRDGVRQAVPWRSAQRRRESRLPPRLVHRDRDCVGQVEAAHRRPHRNAQSRVCGANSPRISSGRPAVSQPNTKTSSLDRAAREKRPAALRGERVARRAAERRAACGPVACTTRRVYS